MSMGIRMSEARALLALAAFFSPSFPTGGFAYSSGLETAVAEGSVRTTEDLRCWLEVQLAHGALRNDAILLSAAWCAAGDPDELAGIADLAEALCSCRERHEEAMSQGRAFGEAAKAWLGDAAARPSHMPLAVAAGAACAAAGIPLQAALPVFIQGQASNQLQAAIRLSVTGQQGASALLAGLAPEIERLAAFAAGASPDNLGNAALLADIASMNHETLGTRLFLS
jgi:urease accessory protein